MDWKGGDWKGTERKGLIKRKGDYMNEIINKYGFIKSFFFAIILLTISACVFFVNSFVFAKYSIWRERQYGLAELSRAESNRQIAICEAAASKESAKYFAEAEVIRARGVAEANKVIGDSLIGNEAYLRYRWIEGLQTNQMSVVYIPTEAGLPILEAGKR